LDADTDYSRLLNNAGIGTGRATAAASDGADVYGKAMWNESIDDDFQNGVPCFFCSTDHELTCVPAYLSNCTQVYFVTAAFMPLLENAKSSPTGVHGSVINTASIGGLTNWY
jgi:NAD(P)-dependent dehydrogenase (short-subunit alcohol dehydrogenase family)